MKRRFIILCLTAICALCANGDDWRSYLSFHNVTQALPINGRVYAMASGGLFCYAYGDSTVQTYSKSTGLSSTDITHMAYCEELGALVVVYSDYNIDIVDTNDSILNIPQYKNSSFTDKTVNDLTVSGTHAFLATNFGVVEINLERGEYTNAYETGFTVNTAIADDDYVYAFSRQGVYVGERTANLLEKANWQQKSLEAFSKVVLFNDTIYGLLSRGLYMIDTGASTLTSLAQGRFTYLSSYGHDLVFGNSDGVNVLHSPANITRYPVSNDFSYAATDDQHLWAARGWGGLQAFSAASDSTGTPSLTPVMGGITPNSPMRNYFSEMHYTPAGRLLVAGGALAYSGKTSYEGTVMAYDHGRWLNFSEDSIALKTGLRYLNITSVAEDPNDNTHHFASSATTGIYEFRNGQFVALYNHLNSPITSIYPRLASSRNYNRITGLTYDSQGNLWMFNNQVDTIIRVITPQGRWIALYQDQIDGYPTFDNYLFDSRGWVWITHRRWAGTYYAGIGCLNYNGTLSNPNDDRFAFCTTFTDQNGNTLSVGLLYTAAFDRNGQLWIGTDQGVLVLEDPTTIFNTTQTFHRPLIPRNDGTNYADYLLEGVPVKCIAVDGANRKWLGTTNNGLYLVSEDGLEVISHFTTDNSPLLSNSILSLAIEQETGLVMIGTDEGLVSYRGDATEPADELKESNIKVFPNPVRPNYTGKIRITGFTSDSDVKITTTSGQVVAQGTSLGGTFTWDGRNKAGDRVATGVYFVVASDSEAKNGIVAKILMVR